MSKTKPATEAASAAGSAATGPEQPNYRNNPEVDARIDAYIKEHPGFWTHVQGMPRERLERTVVLHEIRQIDRQQRMREGAVRAIARNPEQRQALEVLVKDLPADQREAAMEQIARQAQRASSRARVGQEAPPRMGMGV